MNLPKYLKMHLEGGIGDCIKLVTCNYPLRSLYEKYGTETLISYGGEGYNDCGWSEILKETFNLVPGLKMIDLNSENNSKIPSVQDILDNSRFLHDFHKSNGKTLDLERFLPLDLPKDNQIPRMVRNIGIQLSSNDGCKMMDFKKWNQLINLILEKYLYTNIYLFDSPDKLDKVNSEIELKDKRVHNTLGNNLAQSISLISQMDLFISSDSFSKYICLCENIPCIILCADVGFMTPSDLLRSCFLPEIVYNDNFKLVGTEYGPDFFVKSMVKDINEINMEDVFKHV